MSEKSSPGTPIKAQSVTLSADMNNPLSPLLTFDLLEVGPVKLEPLRLMAPYRLVRGGTEDQMTFIYRFEEKVFEPDDPESRNLAAMMAVQVALNYGLFSRRLVFHGPFDAIDRQFIRTMTENTSREIFVKKFLEKNPFLRGLPAMKPVVSDKFTQAVIEFPESGDEFEPEKWQMWSVDKHKVCILSSGGKDSLLSFGLLDELCRASDDDRVKEVHPVFVNESGRHWFTALNAYRHFRELVPLTARVWVNSDRMFTWFLRHMPFIRKDFADVRSDQYPIRLWTVAIFLFAALPLLRRRNIGSLVIGDEYDTTVRKNHQGIPHYDGLFDQSRYFDDAMSRYFLQKGWAISQFSILRPLSEMLIEKILSHRYPHLLQLQVSCHAAHKEGDVVRPCGRCEKCRRIVGMMMALDSDPKACGYTEVQIHHCLDQLVEKGVHQETEGTQQLRYMLMEKGLIMDTVAAKIDTRYRPEILSIRIDPERSPINAIPMNFRHSLFEIFLQYTNGAVRRIGEQWVAFNPLSDPAFSDPYPFELDQHSLAGVTWSSGQTGPFIWGELNWPCAENRLKQVDIALLPIGAIEQHGPHLPLDTDAFDADYLAIRTAEACSDPKPFVLPLISYGVSYHHVDFKGTISISNETLSRLVYDIGMSAAANGIRKLVIINGHGGNAPALNHAAQMINRDARIFVCVDTGETSDVDIEGIVDTTNDVHAGEIETSTTLAVRPHLVHMDLAKKSVPRFSSRYLNFSSKRGVSWYAYTRKISRSGVMGDPTRADAEKGKRIWETMIAHLVAFVEHLKRMTLDEIHQRRY